MATTAGLTRARGRPRGRTKAETRELILNAAEACFAQFGYDAATNRRIAEGSGVTSGAIYQHFASKLDLYVAVHERAFVSIGAEFDSVPQTTATLVEALQAMFEIARRLTAADSWIGLFAVRAATEARSHPEIATALGDYLNPIHQVYQVVAERAIESGEVIGLSVGDVVAGVGAIIEGLTQSAWYAASPKEWGALIDRFVALVPAA